MIKWKDSIFTNAGKQLLAQVNTGDGVLTYTTAKLYQQAVDVSTEDALYETVQLKDLTGEVASTDIVPLGWENNTSHIQAEWNNAKLTEDLTFNSVGWWAKLGEDGTEVLLAISPTNAESTLIAGAGGNATAAISATLDIAVDSAKKVNLVASQQGAVSQGQLQALLDQLRKDLSSNSATDLANGYDLNDLLKGTGIVNDGVTVKNLPAGMGEGFVISYRGVDTVQQVAFDTAKGQISMRSGKIAEDGSVTWKPWKSLDLSQYVTKDELKTMVDDKTGGLVSQNDYQSLQNRVIALEQANADKEKRLKKVENLAYYEDATPISEADFDAKAADGTLNEKKIYTNITD